MVGWRSGLCRGSAAKQTLPVPGRRSSAPSGMQASPPPLPQSHIHVPVRGAGEEEENAMLKRKRINVLMLSNVDFLKMLFVFDVA